MKRLCTQRYIQVIVTKARRAGEKVVFTNGVFDILHRGHVEYLTKAKSFGDILIVGLNNDQSVRRIKGTSRPIQPQADRAAILLALSSVDYVVMFGEETPEKLISIIRPDILVKGADYTVDKIVGAGLVLADGGRVRRVRMTAGRSTTNILRKLGVA